MRRWKVVPRSHPVRPVSRRQRALAATPVAKRPFQFSLAVRRIRGALKASGVAEAAMFDLAAQGHDSLFEQLVACIISIRTRDEVSLPTAQRHARGRALLARVAKLKESRIDELIRTSSFHAAQAGQIRDIARRRTVAGFGDVLPCDFAVLTSFQGVGRKCANLALGIACGESRIGVDIHVHRVTNRWRVIAERTPERSLRALERVLPQRYRVDINQLLVPCGKHVCTGKLPRCSTCPVLDMCQQVGETSQR